MRTLIARSGYAASPVTEAHTSELGYPTPTFCCALTYKRRRKSDALTGLTPTHGRPS